MSDAFGPSVTLDLEGALHYTEDLLRRLFGKDSLSQIQAQRWKRIVTLGIERASFVRCVGLERPVPIHDVYIPTRFERRDTELSLSELLETTGDLVIRAGPGGGKTTLLHWLLISNVRQRKVLPLLFPLRRDTAIDDLNALIHEVATTKRNRRLKHSSLLLLIDGYDEISIEQRKGVSELLELFQTTKAGRYILTCRSYYDLIDLTATTFYITPFSTDDSTAFIEQFSKIYEVDVVAADFVNELKQRGFSDFLENPLLLTLICVLKTGPMRSLPKNTIGLIRRALETLTLRWDDAKGIQRDTVLPLDGEERVRCLMRISYKAEAIEFSERKAHQLVREHLALIDYVDIDPERLLKEMAQWYGLLVPGADGEWRFVHRTIYDYLGARFWVESGLFKPRQVRHWDTRGAYAACLTPDATDALYLMLSDESEIHMVVECFYNNASFNANEVAAGIEEHFSNHPHVFTVYSRGDTVEAATPQDAIFRYASNALLEAALSRSARLGGGHTLDLIRAYCLVEMQERSINPSDEVRGRLRQVYKGAGRIMRVTRNGVQREVRLQDLLLG